MVARIVVMTVLVLAVWSVPAVAEVRYPGQRPAGERWLYEMRDMAGAYWEARAVPGCVADIDLADSLAGDDGRGWYPASGECLIALRAGYVARQLSQARRPWRGFRYGARLRLRRGHVADLCALVVHEVGHTRGLEHVESGVMAERHRDVPEECRSLARRLVPRLR